MRLLIGYFGILVVLLLGLFCSGLAVVGWAEGGDMFVPLLPVEPDSAATALGVIGFLGIGSSLAAIRRNWMARLPLFVWSLGLSLLLFAAVFRNGYAFDGIDDFRAHGWRWLGSLVLVGCTWVQLRTRRKP